jgi:hypothetical protein
MDSAGAEGREAMTCLLDRLGAGRPLTGFCFDGKQKPNCIKPPAYLRFWGHESASDRYPGLLRLGGRCYFEAFSSIPEISDS